MNPTFQSLIDKIRTAPRAVTIPAGLFAGILVLAGVAALTPRQHTRVAAAPAPTHGAAPVSQSHPKLPASAPATTHAQQTAAPSTNPPISAATAVTPPPAKAATAAATAMDVSAMQVSLPGVSQPLNLKPQRAHYMLNAAQRQSYTVYKSSVRIGESIIEARTSEFGSLPAKALNPGLPSEGRATETWRFWTEVKSAGTHAFALRIDSGVAIASLMIDGQTKPVVQVQSYGTGGETGVGAAELGAGWHTITLQIQHSISPNVSPGDVTATLFLRGPHDSAPHSIVPFAVDESSATPATVASVATAPRGAK